LSTKTRRARPPKRSSSCSLGLKQRNKAELHSVPQVTQCDDTECLATTTDFFLIQYYPVLNLTAEVEPDLDLSIFL